MNTTYHIMTTVSIGMLASLNGVVAAESINDSPIEIIEQPAESDEIGNFMFSDDGELRLFHTYIGGDSDIYRYEDGEWTLIRRDLSALIPSMTPIDLSADGSVVLMTDYYDETEVFVDSVTYTMPISWDAESDEGYSHILFGIVRAGHVSKHGNAVTYRGVSNEDRWPGSDSLVWYGESELVNISLGLSRGEGISMSSGLPNADGSVIAFEQVISDDGTYVWLWENGSLTAIPRLDPLSDEAREVRGISADGSRVFGNDSGPARGSPWASYWWGPLSENNDWSSHPVNHPKTAWVWSEDIGIVPIADETRFLETSVIDIDDSGQIALMEARPYGSNYEERYLWYGGDDFVLIDDLLDSIGAPDSINGYSFWQISGDGTKLMGAAYIDERIYAVIVTIPVR